MTDPVFLAEGVAFAYKGTDRRVLDGASLRVPLGAKLCLVGPNGVGKSTLLYLLGLLAEQPLLAGRIECRLPGDAAAPYERLSSADRARLRARRFGFVLQDAYLMPQLTCAENVAMPLLLAGQHPDRAVEAARASLHAAGGEMLASLADRLPDTLSGGQRRLMAVLRALIHSPDVVFADEPTQSLDAEFAPRVLGLLDEWHKAADPARPRTLLLVLHEARLVEERAGVVAFLGRDGRLRDGSPFPLSQLQEEAEADGISTADRIDRWVREAR